MKQPSTVDQEFPHDGMTFEELSANYNYYKTSDRRNTLVDLVIQECRKRARPVCVLDIGCGTGIGEGEGEPKVPFLPRIRENCDTFWGIEPDQSVDPAHGLFDRFEHASMETANLPEASVDVAFSFFVMEHIEDPLAFMQAVKRCLKPGGCYLFLTPNGRHYFTLIARLFKFLGISDLVLRLIRGKALVDSYHYPVQYKFNDRQTINACIKEVGLDQAEFAFIESDGARAYFRGPAVVIYWLLVQKRKIFRCREVLLEMICRVKKLKSVETRS